MSGGANGPLVSVIIPCFNQGRYLADALESVFAQTHQALDVVVVDDGSSDSTPDVAARYAGRIQYIRQPNRGASAARNTGFSASSGALIQYLDADDTLEPLKIERHAAFLQGKPAVGIVYGDVRYFTDENPNARLPGLVGETAIWSEQEPWTERRWRGSGTMLEKLVAGNMLALNSALLRRSVVERVGPWDEDLKAIEDWCYWLRCALAGVEFRFVAAPGTLALVRSHEESTSRDRPRNDRATLQMAIKYARALPDAGLRYTAYRGVVHQFLRIDRASTGDFAALVASAACPRVFAHAAWMLALRNPVSVAAHHALKWVRWMGRRAVRKAGKTFGQGRLA